MIRIVNFFLEKHCPVGSLLLHAGCGNGDVDEKAGKRFKILSLDMALRTNNSSSKLAQGDVFRLPIKNSSIDGIYNLGLVEHFTENEIIEMLKEYQRLEA
ncbi:MAG: class I SAM-dependent methyltransferase [Candidatus Omnitrophica bacterium]|nr:class I SAM-dependent methyltransferase [Candidatus Omnitrophota bacterium]